MGTISNRPAFAENSMKAVEVLEYEALVMEAVWKIEVEDFPAFTVINHEGKDFYSDLESQKASGLIQVGDSGYK